MQSQLLEFLAGRNIEIALAPSGELDSLPIVRYDVIMTKGKKAECFVIFGLPESEQRMTPEDALRALFIRAQLHKNNAAISSSFDKLCRETATRLKYFLGPDNYSVFLDMGTSTEYKKSEKEEPCTCFGPT